MSIPVMHGKAAFPHPRRRSLTLAFSVLHAARMLELFQVKKNHALSWIAFLVTFVIIVAAGPLTSLSIFRAYCVLVVHHLLK